MTRRLALKGESLAALSTEELAEVAGGMALPTTPVRDCPYLENTYFYCITRGSTCSYC